MLSAGRGVVASWPPRAARDVDPPIANSVVAGIPPVIQYRDSPSGGATQLLAYAGIEARGRIVGAARVVLDAPAPVQVVLRRSGWLLLGLVCGDALLVLALGYFVLTQMVVRPLRKMERATAQVGVGDWDQHIDLPGPSELSALARAFNQMTSSLAAQREQLIRSEKLASVGQLAAGVAHEIGNPLAAILGYVDILRADAAGTGALPEAERRDALDRVKAETQRINRIIRDLLEYSRPSHEEPSLIDPLAVVRSAQALLAPQARLREVRMTVTPEAGPWPAVMVSQGRMTQVLVNLLLNAADAMSGKGQVAITCESAAGRVRIAVSDEGPGIGRELRRKVFDPFFTTKPPGQGTGLGLSISRAIVETYGGTLELDPEVSTRRPLRDRLAGGGAGTGAVAGGRDRNRIRLRLRFRFRPTVRGLRREAASALPAIKQQHGDVVGASSVVRRLDQLLRGIVQVNPRLEQVADGWRFHHARQPIRAEQEDIAVLDLGSRDVDLHRVFHAKGARDHVSVREFLLLVLRHARPGLLVVLEQRMVTRELLDRAVADAIAARIARRGQCRTCPRRSDR